MNKELEEAAVRKYGTSIYEYEQIDAFIEGAKWQAERMYSEEDMREVLFHALYTPKTDGYIEKTIDEIVRETMSTFKKK
jgi:hypothetical protein